MPETRLNPLDAAWIFTETRATPNHVGGLLQFRLPPDAPKGFLRRLMTEFRSHREFVAPWNRRLQFSLYRNPVPSWVEDEDIDLEYHVRHAALPWPGGERELGELVGRLLHGGGLRPYAGAGREIAPLQLANRQRQQVAGDGLRHLEPEDVSGSIRSR